eukprot:CAMPEP_0119537762 /NCGR_PEP_ID=MMETSP1344-20130328/50345_1 /TAXON_ID=236787 /ORGANISM="Florenciella parvula, Strain CCMP2471" /LENGTH=96 /DNA_ID=CAMNT_0007580375 /DNA_START=9 /DNA_END=295 /DNA_ORIENTATION=+
MEVMAMIMGERPVSNLILVFNKVRCFGWLLLPASASVGAQPQRLHALCLAGTAASLPLLHSYEHHPPFFGTGGAAEPFGQAFGRPPLAQSLDVPWP